MADNVVLNEGTGGDTIAADDVSGVKYQIVKLAVGADGAASLVANANPIPVSDAGGSITVDGTVTATVSGVATAANQSTEIAALAAIQTAVETLDNAVSGSELQVDIVGALPAGGNTIGSVNLGTLNGAATAANQSTANTALSAIQTAVEALDNAVSGSELQVDIVGALPAGANTIGAVNLGTLNGAATAANQDTANTALTAIQTAVEALDNAVSGSELQVDVVGSLPAGTNNIGDVDVLSVVPGTGASSLGKAEDSAHTTADVGVMMLAVRRNTAAVGSDTDGDYSTLNVDGTGRVWTHDPVAEALLTTVDADTSALAATISGGRVTVDGSGVTQPVSGTVTANLSATDNAVLDAIDTSTAAAAASLAVLDNAISGSEMQVDIVAALPTGANLIGSVIAAGAVAHGSSVSGNPVLVAAEARTSDGTAVTNGQAVRAMADAQGKLVTVPGALHTRYVSGVTNITDTASDDMVAAAASTRTVVTGICVTNKDATVGTVVSIRDGTTVKVSGYAAPLGGGFVIAPGAPIFVGTANTAVTAICGTDSSDCDITVWGYQIPG